MKIAVGQLWVTRSGKEVRVTCDRGEDQRWRWALSNSHIANDTGQVDLNERPHPSDLMHVIDIDWRGVAGMDSTMGGL